MSSKTVRPAARRLGADAIRRHEARLLRAFRRAMWLSMGVSGALAACDSDGTVLPAVGGLDATDDQTMSDGPGSGGDAPMDASVDTSMDAGTADALGEGTGDASVADVDAGGCHATSGAYRSDAGTPCIYFVDFSCAPYPTVNDGSCSLPPHDCLAACSPQGPLLDCEYQYPACVVATGQWLAEAGQPVTVGCGYCAGAGRRPAGLLRPRSDRTASTLGAYFAAASRLEAASVWAFERLGRELGAHRAPRPLVVATRRAARDEVLHACAVARLARSHGAEPMPARVRPGGVRKLATVARENAIEGCVRETLGALIATWQSVHAPDARVRRTMARIARDETRHAALAWAVHEWASRRLDPRESRRVERARRAAVAQLMRDAALTLPEPARLEAGLPSAQHTRALVRTLFEQLSSRYFAQRNPIP